MKAAIVLHLYQPPVQDENVFKQIASECYLPLIRLIKNGRNHKFTLNISLSLLEQMEKYGFTEWVSDVRALYEGDRVELLGSAAYHPLLTKIPQQLIEEQITLNEYGLGYYFGSRHGFEGEPSIMIKNVQGFFPPELAVNNDLAKTLSEFNYKWFLAEEDCLPSGTDRKSCIFGIEGENVLVVCRDKILSNMISFKREPLVDDIDSYLEAKSGGKSPLIVALDAEYFGHHYREGIHVLECLLDKLEDLGSRFSTVSELVEEYEYSNVSEIKECSWGSSEKEFENGDLYPFWIDANNSLQSKMWKLQDLIVKEYLDHYKELNTVEFQTLPLWKDDALKSVQESNLYSELCKFISLHKILYSDKFWWASKKEILGKYLYDISILSKTLVNVQTFFDLYETDETKTQALEKAEQVRGLLK